jgi:HTH-type transcriptional regulator/antitoxin HigA
MPKTKTGHKSKTAVADDYLDLVRNLPLRPIRSDAEYAAAAAVLDRLAVRDEGTLTAGETDYLDALTAFVEMYDERHHAFPAAVDPLRLLRELKDQRGTTVTALGALFGSKGVASELLSGKRPLTLKAIEKLAAHFRVEPAIFLPALQPVSGPRRTAGDEGGVSPASAGQPRGGAAARPKAAPAPGTAAAPPAPSPRRRRSGGSR